MRIGALQQSDYGWLAVLAVVAAAEVSACPGQMLSHAMVRYKAAHPVVVTAVVLTTAAHLLEWIPPPVDPFHRLACWFGK